MIIIVLVVACFLCLIRRTTSKNIIWKSAESDKTKNTFLWKDLRREKPFKAKGIFLFRYL